MRINKRASLERVYPHHSFTSGGINSHTIRNIRAYTIDRHSGVVFMLNENSDGTVLCRYGVRWARAGCCRNKSFMNNSAGMYNTNTSNGGFVMSEKIYLKIDQKRYVKKPKVTIGDVMTVYCSDKDMIEKIGHITLVEFTLGKYDRKVFDALDVVGIIQKEYPDADIECLGECDFVVEYKKPEKEGTVHWIKVAVICFITMVGSGYGIIAYNNDVSTTDIFDRVYELLGASAYKATNAMEIAYAVGLFIGIVIFYDHFAGQKLSKAPTPLEVEMDKYDKDISESVIDREGGK